MTGAGRLRRWTRRPGEEQRVVVLVEGRVQGVGFRAWTRRRLRALGMAGEAVNLPDGRVRITASGPTPAVRALLDDLREGSGGRPGSVRAVTVHEEG